ncbi:MAG: endopeptidase La [Succinatimonas sp.]|nr:endopeptidase La [Succinatimonas sp.]
MTKNTQAQVVDFKKDIRVLPLFSLRGLAITPKTKMELTVSRESSIASLKRSLEIEHKPLAVCFQYDIQDEKPQINDIYPIGVLCEVLDLEKDDEFTYTCHIAGVSRFKLLEITENEDKSRFAKVEILKKTVIDRVVESEYVDIIKSSFQYALSNKDENKESLIAKDIPQDLINLIQREQCLSDITDDLAQVLSIRNDVRVMLIGTIDPVERAKIILGILNGFSYRQELERNILEKAKASLERSQKEYFLNEQLRAIKKELNPESDVSDVDMFKKRMEDLECPQMVKDRLRREISKMNVMSINSSEYSFERNYIETLLNIPWGVSSKLNYDLKKASEILDKDHYGLKKVKDCILEYLAVQAKSDKTNGSILCFMGPPGIGKTSLAQSIARATGRKYVRLALGGLHDEAEIRGHRRTYLGSLPGRIMQNIINAKVNNPLFLLDEIDKTAPSYHGDPANALLEVLDPEQNHCFEDNYVELGFDLSKVLFVTTANSYNISQPLLDRMEIIDLSSYTEEEKFNIAKQHLLPKQMRLNALKDNEFGIEDEALYELIRYYTHEAGVRGLERLIKELARKVIKEQMLANNRRKSKKKLDKTIINVEMVGKLLGPRRYDFTSKLSENKVGLVNGLAWTSLGGDILQLEAVANEGKGKHLLTGKLGDVMKESISAAITVVRTLTHDLHLSKSFYETCDLHIHVPEGATPKEGPSAGVGMVTAIVSVLTGNPVRADVAMTGEITLRGDVLPIGGLKEKLVAAMRGGIKTVLIPFDNEKDLWDIPENIKVSLKIIPVKRIEEVLNIALENDPKQFMPTTVWSEQNKDLQKDKKQVQE